MKIHLLSLWHMFLASITLMQFFTYANISEAKTISSTKKTNNISSVKEFKSSKNPQNKAPKKLHPNLLKNLYSDSNYSNSLLLKIPGIKETYWLGPNKRLYYFQDRKVWISWFGDNSPAIYELPSDLYNKLPKAGPVIPRSGTYLIKFNDTPAVYAIEPKGVLRPIENESAALRFYGPQWNKRIIVFESNTQSYFTIDRLLTYNDYPPEGTLVKRTGNDNIYQAKWKQLTLITKPQWDGCNFLPQWVTQGDWDYPENPPFRIAQLLNCTLESQMPKLITDKNKLAQKDHLRILNTEFIESTEQLKPESYSYCYNEKRCYHYFSQEEIRKLCPTCEIKPLRFFEVFNSKNKLINIGAFEPLEKEKEGYVPVATIYEVKDWLERQYKENGRNLTVDFEVLGPLRLNDTYESLVTRYSGEDADVASGFLFRIGEEYLRDMGIEKNNYDVINLIFYDSTGKFKAIAESSAEKFNLIVVYKTVQAGPLKQSVHSIAHETLHVLGAKDIHQNTFSCPIPDGLADPFKEPLYPQTKSVIMCAPGRFVKNRTLGSSDSTGLEDVILGESVIRDFGWK